MAEKFKLRLYTPAGLLAELETSSAKLPSADGEIGILPRHTKYAGLLGKGRLEFGKEDGSGSSSFEVEGGFIQFDGTSLTILADKAG